MFRPRRFFLAGALALSGAISANASINLEFRPLAQTVNVGNPFNVGLYAVSDSVANQSIASIDALMSWDPVYIQLIGLTNNGPYSWFSSNFPNDAGVDGLNAPYTPIPANDGDAYYRAFRNFSNPAFATPAGLLVTTFTFNALALTPSTSLLIPSNLGSGSRSYVVDGLIAGLEVTGALGSSKITITPEPGALSLLAGAVVLCLIRRSSRRAA
jgi:hypothetical protein